MVTTVRSRPSHYEVLGLTPAATEQEIGQAFARKMSLFRARPLADLAQVTAAYETLRNPETRREYDRSLAPKPEPKPERLSWSFALAQPAWKPFIASVPTNPASPPPATPVARASEPHVTAESEPKPAADPRLEAIAASLRELSKPGFSESPVLATKQEPSEPLVVRRVEERQSAGAPEPALDDVIQQIRIVGRSEKEMLRDGEARWPDWRKPVFAAGGLILGVGILGGMAGVAAGGAAQDSVTVAVPAAKPAVKAVVPTTPGLVEAQAEQQPAEAKSAVARTSHVRSLPKPGFAEKDLVDLTPAVASAPVAAVESVGEEPAATPVPASLPLSNSVIARTIERIGYSCGEVASATHGDGDGVFNITCSSGQSYQATPVRGRYHFRRLGAR